MTRRAGVPRPEPGDLLGASGGPCSFSLATRASPKAGADIGCWPVISSRSTTTLGCQLAMVSTRGAGLRQGVDGVVLDVAAQAAGAFERLLLARREDRQAVAGVGPAGVERTRLAVAGDHRGDEGVGVRQGGESSTIGPWQTIAGRAAGVVEAGQDLAEVLVLQQVRHRGVAARDETGRRSP